MTKPTGRPRHRPSDYTLELATEICDLIATEPFGLAYICNSDDRFPHKRTAERWLGKHPEFAAMYEDAKERQADLKFDQAWEIAAKSTFATVSVDRLKIDTIKWQAAHLRPRKYGARTIVAGDDSAPLVVRDVTDLDRAKGVANLLAGLKEAGMLTSKVVGGGDAE